MTFSVDTIASILEKSVLSFPVSVALIVSTLFVKKDSFVNRRFFKLYVAFLAVRILNHAATRLIRNNFNFLADKPVFKPGVGQGDIVLVTGGSTGIGKDVVELISKHCDKIAVFDLAEPQYKPKKGIIFYKVDVSNPESVHEAAIRVRSDLGHPTIIYNNAGIAPGSTILSVDPKVFLKTFKVNVLGPLIILQEFLPHIVGINHGHIITTASSASYMTITQLSAYTASKNSVMALHDTLTQELRWRYNAPRVRTSVFCPAKVTTNMGDNMKEQDNQFLMPTLRPRDVAQSMVDAALSGLSQHVISPYLAGVLFPFAKALPDWFKYILDVVGDTKNTITDEGTAKQGDYQKFLEFVHQQHDKFQ